jgi:hypothetical protein
MLGHLRLRLELAAWRRAGKPVLLWWRDDDAIDASPALDRLLAISGRHGAPLALAVVPDRLSPDLAPLVNAHPDVSVLQHGLDHRSRRDAALPPAQFGDDESASAIALALAERMNRLADFDHRLPVYVPPWNTVQPNLIVALRQIGLKLSAFDGLGETGRVDTHLDLLRWGKRPRFRGAGRLMSRLARILAERRRLQLWDRPVGLLTHHLDHDEPAWRFLDTLFGQLNTTRGCRWLRAEEAFGLIKA